MGKEIGTVDRAVRVRIRSLQYDYRESLSERIANLEARRSQMDETGADRASTANEYGDMQEDEVLYNEDCCGDSGEPFEMVTEGRLRLRGNLCELSYMECGGENGLEDTRTTLVFSRKRPETLTLTRTGMMRMTLSFEEGRHHIGTYHIGALESLFSDGKRGLSIASYARRVENSLLDEGTLVLDYIIEVRGMDTQRTVFSLSICDLPLVPNGFLSSDCSPEEEGDIQ